MTEPQSETGRERTGHWFLWAVSIPTVAVLVLRAARTPTLITRPEIGTLGDLTLWTLAVAGVGLFPVPVSRKLHLNLNYPILLGVALLYPPITTAWVALIGSFDPRELKGEISFEKALFNRAQYALSWMAGSAVFHSLTSVNARVYVVVPSVLLAAAADYLVNISMVSSAIRFLYGTRLKEVLARLRMGAIHEFLLNYVGLGFVGLVMARLYFSVGMWAVIAFIFPLAFARQMFFRNLALEEAHKELKERQDVLRALSNRMAEERQDERMRIAEYLHDDLAQMLFRLTLQAEMAKKRLSQGDTTAASRDLDGILDTKQQTSDAVRALIRDLHRSPIGRHGLAEALESFAEDMSRGPTRVATDMVDVSLPPPITLLIYQIAREATMNALKHAEATRIDISLTETDDGVALTIRDDGKGFDTSAPQPEGHFGSVMMRERALVAGGTYSRESAVGRGTTITATFPRVWVEEGTQLEGNNGQRTAPLSRPPVGATMGPQAMVPLRDGTDNWVPVEQLASLAATADETEPEPAKSPEARPVRT